MCKYYWSIQAENKKKCSSNYTHIFLNTLKNNIRQINILKNILISETNLIRSNIN